MLYVFPTQKKQHILDFFMLTQQAAKQQAAKQQA